MASPGRDLPTSISTLTWVVAAALVLAATPSLAQDAAGKGDPAKAAANGLAPELVAPEPGTRLGQPLDGWTFTWKAPTAMADVAEYHFVAQPRGAARPAIDRQLRKPAFTFIQPLPVSAGDWTWKVRAKAGSGEYGPWSEERPFTVVKATAAQSNPVPGTRPAGTPPDPQPDGPPGAGAVRTDASTPAEREREKTLRATLQSKRVQVSNYARDVQRALANLRQLQMARSRAGDPARVDAAIKQAQAVYDGARRDLYEASLSFSEAQMELAHIYLKWGETKAALTHLKNVQANGVEPVQSQAIALLETTELGMAEDHLERGERTAALQLLLELRDKGTIPAVREQARQRLRELGR